MHPGRAQKWSGLTPMTANMVGNQVCIRYTTANCIQTDDLRVSLLPNILVSISDCNQVCIRYATTNCIIRLMNSKMILLPRLPIVFIARKVTCKGSVRLLDHSVIM